YLDTAPEFSGEKIQIDDIKYYDGDNTDLEKICSPQNLFYTIYTSGTTGRPKGGLLTNRNLVNYATWFTRMTKLSQRDRTVLVSSFAFDLGYTIFLGSLLSGGELHLISKDTYIDPSSLLDYIKEKSITYMKMTPSLFSIIVNSPGFTQENCSTLRLLVLGGEEIIPLDVEKAQSICTGLEVMNHYGPTETTIGSVARYIEPDRLENFINRPTIGKPINNTRIYILNAHLNPLPIGIPGELCIGGDGVARGYLNRQELTKQKFTADPFRENERIYRTGDMARRLPDGNVEFLGRKDNQVKIRGFRVELGEIEARLLEHNQIKDAVIITRDEQGTGKYLCAYCVPRTPGYVLEIGELRQLLSENLPDYMIPAYFLQLEAIPLNPNGKTDKNALPEPEMKAGGEYIPPADEREKQLVDLWAESLQVENETISAGVSFFDLGGHSLSAAILIAKIHKAFDVKVPIVTIFEKPTIREQSEYIKDAKEAQFAAIAPVEIKDYYVLSSAQNRLYFLQQLKPESIAYNIYDAVVMEGEPEPERLRITF
ncbi:MAG: amino acid adenylation domain-containing protein, partial [bacterium]|nr:amino acid adenylation domain-containing protein [bacterium]